MDDLSPIDQTGFPEPPPKPTVEKPRRHWYYELLGLLVALSPVLLYFMVGWLFRRRVDGLVNPPPWEMSLFGVCSVCTFLFIIMFALMFASLPSPLPDEKHAQHK